MIFKSDQDRLMGDLEGVLGGLGRVLGSSWEGLGARFGVFWRHFQPLPPKGTLHEHKCKNNALAKVSHK